MFSTINIVIIVIAIVILCCSIFAECILCDYVPIKFVRNELWDDRIGSLMTFGSTPTTENFENHISMNFNTNSESFINVENPKLIYFSSTHCGYCTQYNPIWEQIVPKLKEKFPNVNFVKVNAVENKETTNEYKVNYFPTIIFENKNGKRMMFKGNRNNIDGLTRFIQNHM